ncbi:MAG: hypothetical protein IJM44_06960 [Ruminococcus sp.]|nr:hypothetical protein [Ruminococcus sp.]
MLIKGTKKYNLRHNTERTEAPAEGCMINGQGLGAVSKLRYGLCPMSFNGCEIISVYNALVYLNKPRPLSEIAFYMERYRLLFGVFGCDPYKLGKVLGHYGAAFERSEEAGDAKAFIISYWTGRRFMSSLHTVFCVRTARGIEVYNRYNDVPEVRTVRSAKELGRGKPIAVYVIKKD